MLKIVITDDHAMFRQGVKRIIEDSCKMVQHVEEASNAFELFELLNKNRYDMAILDLSMPEMGGLEILKQIRLDHPGLPVLILSMHPEELYAMRALKAGASGYLSKTSAPEKLIEAIQKIITKGKYISETVADQLAMFATHGFQDALHESLSDREFDVLRKLSAGLRVTEIAKELYLSKKTISTYRTRILQKLNLKTNAELVRYATEHHLLD